MHFFTFNSFEPLSIAFRISSLLKASVICFCNCSKSITLEEFVRWYHSDKKSNKLIDIDELDEQDILEALDYPRSFGDVPIISDEAFEEYYKNKDKILENIDETHKGNYYWVSFVAGDLDLEVRCPWSFIDFLKSK